ncbi:unnamed protein product [Spirodela intermedia]|uniref:Uncharacterized protein n=2 Tax=Spirodela intermedia TaxID=51605 RepID=A0A7I8K0P7_SPIIN|nr:unnamed protein product [Spirodela intermedia]CAA6654477.1 unnamed protein product [Spirodela intermedia]CAA7389076.1 unnamed protein product [Spirodela intermedia]
MASLILLVSELLHPEDAILVTGTSYPPATCSSRGGVAAAARSFATAAATALQGKSTRTTRSAMSAWRAELDAAEELREARVSVEAVWP